jgi:hypothetical protein
VATHLGVSNTYYRSVEEGRIAASPAMLVSLAELYSTSFVSGNHKENIIININCGTGSHSNSGYVQNYLNNPVADNITERLTGIEHLLQLILLQLKANGTR